MQVNYDKISRSLLLGIAVMFLVLATIGLTGLGELNKLTEARIASRHVRDVLNVLTAILETADDGETGQRGFLVTGKEDYLAPYRTTEIRMNTLLSELTDLTKNDPSRNKNIPALKKAIAIKFAELNRTITVRRMQGFEEARQIVLTNLGKHEMDQIRNIITQMRDSDNQLVITYRNAIDQQAKSMFWEHFLIFAVALVFQVIMGVITINFLNRRKAAEMALGESQQKFQLLVSGVKDYAIYMLDPQGRIMTWNDGAQKIKGYTADEIIGKHFSRFYSEEQKANGKPERELELAIQLGRYEEDGERIRKDGSKFWANVSITPLYNHSKQLTGFAKVTRDISESKEVERRVSEFYSTVSHELRTPLTSIRGTLSLMEKGRLGELPPRAQSLAKIALSESERLIRLINDILDIRKIEAGKLELRREDLDPSEIIYSTFQALASMSQEASVKLISQINTGNNIYGDHDRIIQVLNNLLSNAIKYSSHDSEIIVQVENVNPETIRFSVTDRGPGIAPEQLPKLFKLFQQLDSSDSRPKGGTGLGLTISKTIVEQHGGKIGVDSEVGIGSVFWFELPVTKQPKRSIIRKNIPEQHKVLLVEDDHNLCSVLSEALATEGYRVDETSALKQASEYLETQEIPSVILLDIHLPDGNGLELLQKLRQQVQTSFIPVVIITGSDLNPGEYTDPLLIDWIKKPFDIQRLLNALKLAINPRKPGRPRVLVVDDDAPTRELIKQQLQSFDVECLEANDGIDAIHLARNIKPDLIILDLTMPYADGFKVVEILREEKNTTTPLLIYTAQDLSNDDKDKLRLGLSAYLTKSRTSEEQFLNTVKTLLNGLIPSTKIETIPIVSSSIITSDN